MPAACDERFRRSDDDKGIKASSLDVISIPKSFFGVETAKVDGLAGSLALLKSLRLAKASKYAAPKPRKMALTMTARIALATKATSLLGLVVAKAAMRAVGARCGSLASIKAGTQ